MFVILITTHGEWEGRTLNLGLLLTAATFTSSDASLAKHTLHVNMARGSFSTPNSMQALDSPRSSESPVPQGLQGELEHELLGLANALYNLGTTVVSDLTKEKDTSGGKQVGMRV